MGKRQRRREREFIRAPAPPIPSTPAAVVPASEQGLPKLRKEFRRIFAQLRKSTIKRLRASAQPATVPHEAAVVAAAGDEPTFIPNPQELFSEEEWQAATADLGGAIEGIVTGSAQNVVGSAGYAFDVSNPLMGQAVRAHVDAIASWAPDLQNRVAEVVKEGVDAGWSVDAIAEALAEGPLSEARAILIARTEAIRAANAGAYAGMKQLPFVQRKQWLATEDLRTRDTHREADGQVVPIDAPFHVGGWPAMYPGDPSLPAEEVANCRCTLIAMAEDDSLVADEVEGEDVSDEAQVVAPGQVPTLSDADLRAIAGAKPELRDLLEQMFTARVEAEPVITPLLEQVASSNGGQMQGLANKFKSPDGVVEKIQRKIGDADFALSPRDAVREVNDSLRYTMTLPESGTSYAEGVRGALADLRAAGYDEVQTTNFWARGNAYKGINSTFVDRSTGLQFEVQFHTDATWAIKQATHLDYELLRNPPPGTTQEELFSAFKRMRDLAATAEHPIASDAVGYVRFKPFQGAIRDTSDLKAYLNNTHDLQAATDWGHRSFDAWGADLTPAQQEAFRGYTGSDYYNLNSGLRRGETLSGRFAQQAHDLHQALWDARMPEDVVVRRGVGRQGLEDLFGSVKDGSILGEVFTDPGFMSTSAGSGAFSSDLTFEIHASAGTRGAFIGRYSSFKNEAEVLLPPNTSLRVVEITNHGRTLVMEIVDQAGPDGIQYLPEAANLHAPPSASAFAKSPWAGMTADGLKGLSWEEWQAYAKWYEEAGGTLFGTGSGASTLSPELQGQVSIYQDYVAKTEPERAALSYVTALRGLIDQDWLSPEESAAARAWLKERVPVGPPLPEDWKKLVDLYQQLYPEASGAGDTQLVAYLHATKPDIAVNWKGEGAGKFFSDGFDWLQAVAGNGGPPVLSPELFAELVADGAPITEASSAFDVHEAVLSWGVPEGFLAEGHLYLDDFLDWEKLKPPYLAVAGPPEAVAATAQWLAAGEAPTLPDLPQSVANLVHTVAQANGLTEFQAAAKLIDAYEYDGVTEGLSVKSWGELKQWTYDAEDAMKAPGGHLIVPAVRSMPPAVADALDAWKDFLGPKADGWADTQILQHALDSGVLDTYTRSEFEAWLKGQGAGVATDAAKAQAAADGRAAWLGKAAEEDKAALKQLHVAFAQAEDTLAYWQKEALTDPFFADPVIAGIKDGMDELAAQIKAVEAKAAPASALTVTPAEMIDLSKVELSWPEPAPTLKSTDDAIVRSNTAHLSGWLSRESLPDLEAEQAELHAQYTEGKAALKAIDGYDEAQLTEAMAQHSLNPDDYLHLSQARQALADAINADLDGVLTRLQKMNGAVQQGQVAAQGKVVQAVLTDLKYYDSMVTAAIDAETSLGGIQADLDFAKPDKVPALEAKLANAQKLAAQLPDFQAKLKSTQELLSKAEAKLLDLKYEPFTTAGRLSMTVTDVNTAIARTMAGFAGVPFQNPAGMTGAMIALLPADQEALAQSGGDPAAALHVTVCYLTSDASQLSAEDVAAAQMAAAEAAAAHGPFESTVSGAGVLGGEDPPATVLFLESESFQAVHDHVWSELEDYGSEAWHDQHPGYIPHLTLGYGLDVALAQGLMGTTVAFDRIVVVLADAVTEYQLGVETNQPPGEGEGYGRKRPTGYEEDDMAVPPAPAKAPPPPPAKAPAPPPAKAPAEGDSVTWQDADGNDVTGEVVSFNDPDNKPDSGDETVTVQPEGTTDEADQVTVDASKVKVEEAKPAPSPGQAPPPAPGQTPMTAEHEFVAISEKSWDGSAARFNDDQYQKACAACGPASEGTVKERCFLPHHEPDGTLNRAGVHAAAQRIGSLSGRPADAVSSAKSHLRSHYSDLGEEAPDSVATAAPKDFATGSPASFDAQPSGRWRGVLIVEGLPSGDGRMIEEGALTWRELPLPLMAMFENPVGGMGHDGAELAGRIDNIWRDGGNIWGEGVFDLSGPSGVEAHRLVAEKMMRGVSADLDMVEIDFENPEPSLDAPLEDLLAWDPGMMIVVSGRVMGATCTVFPAFEEATISLLDEAPAEALVASCGVALTGATLRTWLPYNGEAGALVASAGATVGGPAEPPLAWFSMPEFDRDHPIHPVRVTPEGRVYGWVSDWKECHIGFAGRCITPPKTRCNYRRFTTGQVLTAEGELVAVGRVYADTVHPSLKMKASDAAAFYAHSGCCLAYVRAYEDSRGIYIAGAVRPGVTADQVRILRGADMSPDWRPFPGGPEMIGILSVNVSGFVTPDEALVASAGGGYVRPGVTRAWVNADTGSVKALVGAGTAGLRRRSPLAAKVEALEAQLAELKAAIRPLRRDRAVGRASLRNGVELKTELGVSHCGSDCSCRSAH